MSYRHGNTLQLLSTDLPSVAINVDEVCATSINISLNTHNHPACGEVSHDVTISGNVVDPDDDSKYFINGLQSDTLHNITVTSIYNNGSRIFNQRVRTSLPKCKYQILNLPDTSCYLCTIQLNNLKYVVTNTIMSL